MRRVVATLEERFWCKVERKGENECWPWIGAKSSFGHGHIVGDDRFNRRLVGAHRLSLMIADGCDEPPKSVYCLHSCDNPICVNPKHLRWGSASENSRDMFARKRADRTAPRAKRLYQSPKSTMTEDQAKQAMIMAAQGVGTAKIAEAVGASYWVVADICRGKSYQYLHGVDGLPTREQIRSARKQGRP